MAINVNEEVEIYRQNLRNAGFVPDSNIGAGHAKECVRQSQAVRESQVETGMMGFIENASDLGDGARNEAVS